jgi:hypothetical protein
MSEITDDKIKFVLNTVIAELEEIGMKPYLTRLYPDGFITIVLKGSSIDKPKFKDPVVTPVDNTGKQ